MRNRLLNDSEIWFSICCDRSERSDDDTQWITMPIDIGYYQKQLTVSVSNVQKADRNKKNGATKQSGCIQCCRYVYHVGIWYENQENGE